MSKILLLFVLDRERFVRTRTSNVLSGALVVFCVLLSTSRFVTAQNSEFVESRIGVATPREYSQFKLSQDGRHCSWVAIKTSRLGAHVLIEEAQVIDGQEGDYWQEIRNFWTSADWKRQLYLALGFDDKNHWIYDGQEITGYEEIDLATLTPSGHLVFRAKVDAGFTMVLDGKPGPTFSKIWSPEISDDGTVLAYAANSGKEDLLVLAGDVRTVPDSLSKLRLSPNGKRLAYVVNREDKHLLNLDGQWHGPFDYVDELAFGPQGSRFAYEVVQNGKTRVFVDDEPGPEFIGSEFGAATNFTFSHDGRRLAYEVKNNDRKVRIVVDGVAGPEFDYIFDFQFSESGRRYMYQGVEGDLALETDYSIVFENAPIMKFGAMATHMMMTPDGEHFAFVSTLLDLETYESTQQIIVDGQYGPKYPEIESMDISDDGEHLIFLAKDQDQRWVILDDHELVTTTDKRFSKPTLNSDGSRFAYVEWDDDHGAANIIIDGQRGPEYNVVLQPVFNQDGSVEYLAETGDSLFRVLHPGKIQTTSKIVSDKTSAIDGKTIWTVAPDGTGDAESIQSCIEQAKSGDLIRIRPGIYRESLTLDKQLEIVGEGDRDTIIIQSVEGDCFMILGGDATIRGLTLRCRAGKDRDFFAVDVAHGNALIEDCHISSDSLACVGVHGEKVFATLRNCWIRNSNDTGVYFYETAGGTVDDCDIFDNLESGITIEGKSNVTIRHSRVHHNQVDGISVSQGGMAEIIGCDVFANFGRPINSDEFSECVVKDCRISGTVVLAESITSNVDENDTLVDPRLQQLILNFEEPMDTGGWYLGNTEKKYGRYPELRGDRPARFLDSRTFAIDVRLEPETSYALALNTDENLGFQSVSGIPLEPTVLSFRTSGVNHDIVPDDTDGFSIGLSVLKFLEQPTQQNFLKARQAVIASKEYQSAAGDELDELTRLLREKRYRETQNRIVQLLPKLYLSPRVHMIASEAAKGLARSNDRELKMGDDTIQKEYQHGRNCLDAIYKSGNGTQEQPYLVLRMIDEADLLVALGKEVADQSYVRQGEKIYDVVECTDGTKVWFDISSFHRED